MFSWIDRRISLRTLICLFPLVFLIHDVEEIVTVESFARAHRAALPAPLAGLMAVTTTQFIVAVIILFVACCLLASAAARSLRPGRALSVFMLGVAILFLNVLTHGAQTLYFRRYTPGVITAVLVSLPYALYTLHRFAQARLLSRHAALRGLIVAAAIGLPLPVLVLLLVRLIVA